MNDVRTGNSFEKSLASHVRCALGTRVHDGSVIGDQRRIESGAMQGYVSKATVAACRIPVTFGRKMSQGMCSRDFLERGKK